MRGDDEQGYVRFDHVDLVLGQFVQREVEFEERQTDLFGGGGEGENIRPVRFFRFEKFRRRLMDLITELHHAIRNTEYNRPGQTHFFLESFDDDFHQLKFL